MHNEVKWDARALSKCGVTHGREHGKEEVGARALTGASRPLDRGYVRACAQSGCSLD